jgi:hypothetical protein
MARAPFLRAVPKVSIEQAFYSHTYHGKRGAAVTNV